MSDDVSALFAKKREKKLKKNVVKMDDVGQVLERRAKKQVCWIMKLSFYLDFCVFLGGESDGGYGRREAGCRRRSLFEESCTRRERLD